MSKDKFPVTPGTRFLQENKVDFNSYLYEYEDKGGTSQTADVLKIDEHIVIKSLVFENENKQCLLMLEHGDKNVSTKELSRLAGFKKLEPADANQAMKWTGYQFGGTSPFGTKKEMIVYAEETIFELEKIFINGGKRGFIVEIAPNELKRILDIKTVKTAI
ncbi:MAG: YbaK/EbsC family protein [bacterium]